MPEKKTTIKKRPSSPSQWPSILMTALPGKVVTERSALAGAAGDITDIPPETPVALVTPKSAKDIQTVVQLASTHHFSITARGANLNVGGLGISARGGVLLDLSQMNRILEINEQDLYAVLEPGVSFGQLKEYLDAHHPGLTMGYPTAPVRASVLGNCLMDGHVNLSFHHGLTSQWLHGVEAVLADGTMLRTGSWALTEHPVCRAPLPDLTGLFTGSFGNLGLVTRFVIGLQRKFPFSQRYFLLVKHRDTCFKLMKKLGATLLFQDLGALSACTAKMLFGVMHPVLSDPDEPEMFAYVDLGAHTKVAYDAQEAALRETIAWFRRHHGVIEDPIRVEDLIALNSTFARYAKFPMTLDFLVEHPGGGLTFTGTFGPLSRLEMLAAACLPLYEKHGFPPAFVSRLIDHGHFAVLHHVAVFDQQNERKKKRVRKLNIDLVKLSLSHGYLMYKAPDWVYRDIYSKKLSPGFTSLWNRIHQSLDQQKIWNPSRLPLSP